MPSYSEVYEDPDSFFHLKQKCLYYYYYYSYSITILKQFGIVGFSDSLCLVRPKLISVFSSIVIVEVLPKKQIDREILGFPVHILF